jgi:hypothetical protein
MCLVGVSRVHVGYNDMDMLLLWSGVGRPEGLPVVRTFILMDECVHVSICTCSLIGSNAPDMRGEQVWIL